MSAQDCVKLGARIVPDPGIFYGCGRGLTPVRRVEPPLKSAGKPGMIRWQVPGRESRRLVLKW